MHAGAFEFIEVVELEAAVFGAAGDDDGAGAGGLLAQSEAVAAGATVGRALQGHDLVRDGHVGAEFLGLVIGPGHQRDARMPVGKPR